MLILVILSLTTGTLIGILMSASNLNLWIEKYPTMNCIVNLDSGLNVDGNTWPFTKQSQREAVQWRCAKQTVDFNITDYDEILEME